MVVLKHPRTIRGNLKEWEYSVTSRDEVTHNSGARRFFGPQLFDPDIWSENRLLSMLSGIVTRIRFDLIETSIS